MQFVLCVFIYCLQWFLYVAVLFFVHRGVDAWVSCGILFKKNKIKNNVGVFNGFIYLDFSFKLTSVLILFFFFTLALSLWPCTMAIRCAQEAPQITQCAQSANSQLNAVKIHTLGKKDANSRERDGNLRFKYIVQLLFGLALRNFHPMLQSTSKLNSSQMLLRMVCLLN